MNLRALLARSAGLPEILIAVAAAGIVIAVAVSSAVKRRRAAKEGKSPCCGCCEHCSSACRTQAPKQEKPLKSHKNE